MSYRSQGSAIALKGRKPSTGGRQIVSGFGLGLHFVLGTRNLHFYKPETSTPPQKARLADKAQVAQIADLRAESASLREEWAEGFSVVACRRTKDFKPPKEDPQSRGILDVNCKRARVQNEKGMFRGSTSYFEHRDLPLHVLTPYILQLGSYTICAFRCRYVSASHIRSVG